MKQGTWTALTIKITIVKLTQLVLFVVVDCMLAAFQCQFQRIHLSIV